MVKFIKREEKNIHIGLDIGSHSVKAVAITYVKSEPQLVKFSVKAVKNNVINAIKDAHAELGFTKRRVITSLSGPAVVVRYIEMPSMTEEELASATPFETEKVIPYNIDEVILDSAKLEDLPEGKIRVVIVAVKKDLVDTQIKMLAEAELEPLILDIDAFALMNAFVNTRIDSSSVCGLLNIGAKMSNLNIVQGESSYLCRDIDIGGDDITKAITEAFSLNEKEGEKIKEEKLPQLLRLPPEEKSRIRAVLEGVLTRLTEELRLSFDFYESHYSGNVNKVYLSGGTAASEVITNFLKESLGCNVLVWDPLTGLKLPPDSTAGVLDKFKPQLAIAIGLALRRTE